MTKKELEKELEKLKAKNEELEINLDYAKAIETKSIEAFCKIVELCNGLNKDSQITVKIKEILLKLVKKHKELEQEKNMLKEL